jgi:radical SAM superfamily enzyme YgiQ (UPF0313 family)
MSTEPAGARSDVLLVGFEAQENLGLRSIAAFLQSRGLKVAIQPLHGVPPEVILDAARRAKPKIIGFSIIFQRMLELYAGLITYLRENGITAHFTAGGHFPTLESRGTLQQIPGLDSVVRHEGELTLLELFQNLGNRVAWNDIRGLVYRQGDAIRVNPPRPLIADLDSLPFPLRSPEVGLTHRGIDVRSIAASRGCYYHCSFCSISEFYRTASGPRRRSRSAANLVAEMAKLHGDFGTQIFIFQDDDIFMRSAVHRAWLNDFLAELRRHALHDRILWRISCRVDDLDLDIIRRMAEHGLGTIYLGIESGSDRELKTINKGYRARDAYRAIDLMRTSGVPFEFGFMLFTPDTTIESIGENIAFLRYAGESSAIVNFCKMAPYAGTAIQRRLRNEGRLTGTVASPDYDFDDARTKLFQLFATQTFHHRNFDDDGLVELLRFAKFDAFVANRLLGEDNSEYGQAVHDLIRRSNEAAVDTLSFAQAMLEAHDAEAVMDHWAILEETSRAERAEEEAIVTELIEQMATHDATLSTVAALS